MQKSRRNLLANFLIIALLVTALLYFGASWIFAGKLLSVKPQPDTPALFADYGLPDPETVMIDASPIKLASWFFANPTSVPGPAACAVIMAHGIGGARIQGVPAAPIFWQKGCHLLMYDARGHGESTPALHTYGVAEKVDEVEVLAWVSQRTGLLHSQIGIIGWSFGAATSLQMAALAPDVAFVIADSAYSSLEDIARYQGQVLFGDWTRFVIPGALAVASVRAGFNAWAASPMTAVKGLNTPILLVHSTTDHFTPYQHSERIYAQSNQAQTMLYLSRWGAPHGRSNAVNPREYTQRIDEFLAAKAPTFGTPRRQLTANP